MKNRLIRIMHTRVPYVIAFFIMLIIIVFLIGDVNRLNKPVNAQREHMRTEKIAAVHRDNNKIFKYRASMSALSDQHMMYLLHHPKLRNHPQYIGMTEATMQQTDYDSGRINTLTQDANEDRADIKKDHPRTPTNSALHPINTKASNKLVATSFAFVPVVFLCLWDLLKIAKFKDDLKKRHLMGDDDVDGMK